MMMNLHKFQSGPFAERARRSARGIVLATVLTLAAFVFVISAIQNNGSETASITPGTTDIPQSRSN